MGLKIGGQVETTSGGGGTQIAASAIGVVDFDSDNTTTLTSLANFGDRGDPTVVSLDALGTDNTLFSNLDSVDNTVDLGAGNYVASVRLFSVRTSPSGGSTRSSPGISIQLLDDSSGTDEWNELNYDSLYFRGTPTVQSNHNGYAIPELIFTIPFRLAADGTIRVATQIIPQFYAQTNQGYAFEGGDFKVFSIGSAEADDSGGGGGQADDPLTPEQLVAAIRAVGWPGGYSPTSEAGLSYQDVSGTTSDQMGYNDSGGFVRIGFSNASNTISFQRGRLIYEDTDQLINPQDCLMQAAMKWVDGAEYGFFICWAANVPTTSNLGDIRTAFNSGAVIRVKTTATGRTEFAIIETENAPSHFPAIDHGFWQTFHPDVFVPEASVVTDATERNATIHAQNNFIGDGIADDSDEIALAVLNFRNRIDLFWDKIHIARWTWDRAHDPLRTGRSRGRNYFIQSSAGRSRDLGQTVTDQRIYSFGISPGPRDAPDPDQFI